MSINCCHLFQGPPVWNSLSAPSCSFSGVGSSTTPETPLAGETFPGTSVVCLSESLVPAASASASSLGAKLLKVFVFLNYDQVYLIEPENRKYKFFVLNIWIELEPCV